MTLYSSEELLSMVLTKMKQTVEANLNKKVNYTIIIILAYFNDAQQQAMKDAGQIAGLDILYVINEPTAAALAYSMDHADLNVTIIYDLSRGTLNISILEMQKGVFEVKSMNNDTHLGSEDFDITLVKHILKGFKKESGSDLSSDHMVIQHIHEAAEKTKIELSSTLQMEINLPFINADASGPKHINIKLLCSQFKLLVNLLIQCTIDLCKKALLDAGVKALEVDKIILIGSMMHMPMVINTVKGVFCCELSKGVNPNEAIAIGALI